MENRHRRVLQRPAGAALAAAGLGLLAACGGSSSGGAGGASTTPAAAPASSAASGSSPGAKFSAAQVPGLGRVLVDGRGHTVYLLTSGGHHNVPCTDGNGCTSVWPDLPLADGMSAAKAGPGVRASLLGAMKSSDGETYPTYNGWLMYEYTGDTGPAQGNGQGIKSFGGTWYAITPAGAPVKSGAKSSPSSSSGSGYSY